MTVIEELELCLVRPSSAEAKQEIAAANTTLLGGPHVPPTTRAVLISQLQALEVHIEETKSQLRNLPSRVPLNQFGAHIPRLERKSITDVVKIAA